mmetsp:Transcript_1695/g.5479  ORF Transcript_1695/g.5479 Transcript_1695/m.5479 type:complete len:211 (+) Transcript_1695:583-1215(+)
MGNALAAAQPRGDILQLHPCLCAVWPLRATLVATAVVVQAVAVLVRKPGTSVEAGPVPLPVEAGRVCRVAREAQRRSVQRVVPAQAATVQANGLGGVGEGKAGPATRRCIADDGVERVENVKAGGRRVGRHNERLRLVELLTALAVAAIGRLVDGVHVCRQVEEERVPLFHPVLEVVRHARHVVRNVALDERAVGAVYHVRAKERVEHNV